MVEPVTATEPPPVEAPRPAAAPGQPLRPVQYLGNKQRSLPAILATIGALAAPGDSVADLFTGTSVVAQGLANLQLRVTAVDVAASCATMANATLGVGRPAEANADGLGRLVRDRAASYVDALIETFSGWVAAEDDALDASDGARLIELSRTVPQVWRGTPDDQLARLFREWNTAAHRERYFCAVLSPVFAGTYFGVRQAVTLDAYRAAIEALHVDGTIGRWEADTLNTGLLAAASSSAFSPGKHFAQPHRLDSSKDLSFHARRILSDRNVDVADTFVNCLIAVVDRGRSSNEGHSVLRQPVEQLAAEQLRERNIGVVYADPPYTAQQYSRFYHVLDTLATGVPRRLQTTKRGVTGGLYPDGRYLSPYCSKRQAGAAFGHLAATCWAAGASLVLSYSTSARASTGNARMITLSELRRVLARHYGTAAVEVVELEHQYRQFNQTGSARSDRSDPEILVVAHAA